MPHWFRRSTECRPPRPASRACRHRPARLIGRRALLLAAGLLALANPVAAQEIKYLGLHGTRAKVRVEQRNVLLAIGESKNGVRLVAATREGAVLRRGERNYYFARGSSRGELLANELTLERDRTGRFSGDGTINGKRVLFVVDTGASHVALSGAEARRIGLRYSRGQRVTISTASRTEIGYEVVLDSVSLGGIVFSNVRAIITRGEMPRYPLLGMTFLQHLRIIQDAEHMYLYED